MEVAPISEWNQDATVYVGGLNEKAGPVVNTNIVTGQRQGYGFVEFLSEKNADSAIKIMNMIKLYGKPTGVNKASAHNKNLDVGANIFIGNLDPKIGKLLYDTFSAFGVILQTPKIMQDPDTGNSKGYAFINSVSFDALDAAIKAMNRQYLCNHLIIVSCAFKKDSKGECQGSDATLPLSAPNPVVLSLGSRFPPSGMLPPGSFRVLPPGALPPEIPPAMPPPPMPSGTGGHGPQSAGTPGAGHPGHRHSHPHPFLPGGMPHPEMLAHHGPHGLGHPHAGPPGSGGQPPPDHHLECLILDLAQWACPPHPPRASVWFSHESLSSYASGWYAWTSSSDGYIGPPQPPPYSCQQGPLPPPRPTPQPPVPP
uniref:RRM domain-containing protein n=1 Tax=Capra hircus TaxID=9925 RepID=A0A452DSX9_CAPHI